MELSGSGVEVFVFKGSRFLGSRCFAQNTIVVGGGIDAALKLKDPSIADRHATVQLDGTTITIIDNCSEHGVYVNGARITRRAVNSFDEVEIGPFRIKFSPLGGEPRDAGFGDEEDSEDEATRIHQSGDGRRPRSASIAPLTAEPRAAFGGNGARDGGARGAFPRGASADLNAPAQQRPRGMPPHHAPPQQPAEVDVAGVAGSLPLEAPGAEAHFAEPALAIDPALEEEKEDSTEPSVPTLARQSARAQGRRARDLQPDAAADPVANGPQGAERYDEGFGGEEAHFGGADEGVGPGAAPEPLESPGDEDEDEDEDAEEFVEPFSLLENIVRERFRTPVESEPYHSVEVIRYKGGEILDVLRADPGTMLRVGPAGFKLIHAQADARAQLYFDAQCDGTIVSHGKGRSLKRLMRERYLIHPRRGIYGVELSKGDYAQILRPEGGYLVRFMRPPAVPKAKLGVAFNWSNLQLLAGSAAFHFLLLVLLGFAAPEADLRVATDAERFAKVTFKEIELEKPKPEEPDPEPEPPPKQEEPPPAPKEKPKPEPKRRRRRPEPRRSAPPRPSAQAEKQQVQRKQAKEVLSALQNLKPSGGPGRSNLKQLASNVAAVRSAAGAASDFQVAGLVKKLPGNAVRLAGGGGGGSDTKVGSQLLRGSRAGKLKALAGTGRKVRGRVRRAPTRSIKASGGHLSREAIQKVVSKHMAQVQACYERQLIANPGLTGKVVFDWVITPSGGVGLARQVSSSMRSPAVASCILGLIRNWRFPKPVGGSVNVRYPFVFRAQGF